MLTFNLCRLVDLDYYSPTQQYKQRKNYNTTNH